MPDSAVFLLVCGIAFGLVFAHLWWTTPRIHDPGPYCPACSGTGDAPAGSPRTDCQTCGGMGALMTKETAR